MVVCLLVLGSQHSYQTMTCFRRLGVKTSGGLPSSSVGQGGRVRAIMAPKDGTPGAQPKPAQPKAEPLRQSMTLGGEKASDKAGDKK